MVLSRYEESVLESSSLEGIEAALRVFEPADVRIGSEAALGGLAPGTSCVAPSTQRP